MSNSLDQKLRNGMIVGKNGKEIIMLEKTGKYFSLIPCIHQQFGSFIFYQDAVMYRFGRISFDNKSTAFNPQFHLYPDLPRWVTKNNNATSSEERNECFLEIWKIAETIDRKQLDLDVLHSVIEQIRIRQLLKS